MEFEFSTVQKIIFGAGSLSRLGKMAKEKGKSVLLVTGSGKVPIDYPLNLLHEEGLKVSIFRVPGEPDLDTLQRGLQQARNDGCDLVISLGGGSVIDTGKAIAVLLTNPGEITDYLEVVGKGLQLVNPATFMIAVPTTAGTGSEVTRNAVISVPERKVKVSMRSPYLLPSIALVDPQLTLSTPPVVTAASGMDALTQNLEAFTTGAHNPISDIFAHEGLRLVARSIRRVYAHGEDEQAREAMALASLLGGLSLANSGLGAVHGFAGVLGGMYPKAAHGKICAALLPAVVKVNATAISRSPEHLLFLERYREIAQLLTDDPMARVNDGIDWLKETVNILQLPTLSQLGVKQEDFDEIIQKSDSSSSMKKNPVKLTGLELREILLESF